MTVGERTDGFELAGGGVAIRTMRWHPAQPAWAMLLLVHGVGEHAGRYDDVGRQMAVAGIDVTPTTIEGSARRAVPGHMSSAGRYSTTTSPRD